MEKVHGGDIYSYENKMLDFSANINPLGIMPEVADAIRDSVQRAAIYPDTEYRALRKAIADTEKVYISQVICANGAAELIFDITRALRPKRVIFTAPAFAEYEKAADACGCEKLFYTLTEDSNFTVGEDIITFLDRVDMVFLCQPNNPTGKLISWELLKRIAAECADKNVFLVIDECFLDFTGTGTERSAVRLTAENKNLMVLKAFTKMFAIPGIRLGYGICSNEDVLEKIYAQRQPWNVSCTAEAAGIACCGVYAETVRKTREYIEREKSFLYSEFARLKVIYYDSAANYILFRASEGLKEKMADKGILIRSCSNYRGLDGRFYRIAVKGHEDNIKMINALEECLWQSR